ncbi:MAG: PilZ domain-containing protein [Sphingomicrobium sp.]
MKHEAILEGYDLLPRDPRVEAEFPVRVHTQAGDIDAQIVNLSSDGFRLRSENPLQVGWVVTLEAAKQFPVKALICWACGTEAGGVFAEPVAL